MNRLYELKNSIFADGVIDEQEVKQLRDVLYADGVINNEEIEFLFDLKDGLSGNESYPKWESLFVDAITSFLLKDETSPGVVDEDEAKRLLSKIQGGGKLDKMELTLLKCLEVKSTQLTESLLN
jgi:uncharacterized membrane protein YebE (DUF533 family)